jgi:hypothetical protein
MLRDPGHLAMRIALVQKQSPIPAISKKLFCGQAEPVDPAGGSARTGAALVIEIWNFAMNVTPLTSSNKAEATRALGVHRRLLNEKLGSEIH